MLPVSFMEEASASLPTLPGGAARAGTELVIAAMGLQRLRFHHDQGIPEWDFRLR